MPVVPEGEKWMPLQTDCLPPATRQLLLLLRAPSSWRNRGSAQSTISTTFLKKVCQLVRIRASPKQPQSETGLKSARIRVSRVKKDINHISNLKNDLSPIAQNQGDPQHQFKGGKKDSHGERQKFQKSQFECRKVICKFIGRTQGDPLP